MDESANISAKTRARALEPINKLGYMDGASDGQNASFQTSFNIGYEQGFGFGLDLGLNEALAQARHQSTGVALQGPDPDPAGVNCQVCVAGAGAHGNIVNLFNVQKEKNDDYLSIAHNNKCS